MSELTTHQTLLSQLKVKDHSNALAQLQALPEVYQPPSGITNDASCLLILLDCSGSMRDSFTHDQDKIDALSNILRTDLASNLIGARYGIILFPDPNIVTTSKPKWLLPVTSDPKILRDLPQLIPRGGTPLLAALKMAWEYAESKRILLITDGLPDTPTDTILEAVSKHLDTTIDCIGIGRKGNDYEYDPNLLRTICQMTNGIFSEAGDTIKLSQAVKSLSPAQRPLLTAGKAAPLLGGK